jgi:hypothetical protein
MGRQKVQVGRKAAAHLTGVIALYESDIQATSFEFMQTLRLPNGKTIWDYAFATVNGAQLAGNGEQRARAMAALKKQGLKTGVSDIVIAYPLGGFHGAFIEVKRDKSSKVSQDQKDWVTLMKDAGYSAKVTAGLDATRAAILDYWRGHLIRSVVP